MTDVSISICRKIRERPLLFRVGALSGHESHETLSVVAEDCRKENLPALLPYVERADVSGFRHIH